VPVVIVLLACVAFGCAPAARMLAAARWPRRSPAGAIALWQALGLGWGLAAVGMLAGLGALGLGTSAHGSGLAAAAAFQAARLITAWPAAADAAPVPALLSACCLAASCLLLGLLAWVLIAAVAATVRARHRQRALLRLLAHADPKVPGALVVDHPAAAAYCVPGLRSAIVISAGAVQLLGPAELAAVIAHERAHLRERHDLVLLPFTALLRAFSRSRAAREANQAVALLVEMLADDVARRRLPARELATALLRVGTAGGGAAPVGTLAATGSDGDLAARVSRLLRPQPGLPAPLLVMVGAAAVLLVAVPAAAWVVPF
jgi:Zn-dependent protease with chaperone function